MLNANVEGNNTRIQPQSFFLKMRKGDWGVEFYLLLPFTFAFNTSSLPYSKNECSDCPEKTEALAGKKF